MSGQARTLTHFASEIAQRFLRPNRWQSGWSWIRSSSAKNLLTAAANSSSCISMPGTRAHSTRGYTFDVIWSD